MKKNSAEMMFFKFRLVYGTSHNVVEEIVRKRKIPKTKGIDPYSVIILLLLSKHDIQLQLCR